MIDLSVPSIGYTTEQSREKREAELEKMRARFRPRCVHRKPSKKKRRAKKKKAYRPRRGVSLLIEGLRRGDDLWIPSDSKAAHGAARSAKWKIKTRTAYKKGVKGIRIWRVK